MLSITETGLEITLRLLPKFGYWKKNYCQYTDKSIFPCPKDMWDFTTMAMLCWSNVECLSTTNHKDFCSVAKHHHQHHHHQLSFRCHATHKASTLFLAGSFDRWAEMSCPFTLCFLLQPHQLGIFQVESQMSLNQRKNGMHTVTHLLTWDYKTVWLWVPSLLSPRALANPILSLRFHKAWKWDQNHDKC